MSEQTSDQSPINSSAAGSRDERHVTLTRDSVGRYTVRNDRGGSITTSSGTEELSSSCLPGSPPAPLSTSTP